MKLTPEQFLQPRYKAIADYPGAIYKKGHIINCRDDLRLHEFCKKHPDVFRCLQWWQERPLNEMPEYVRGTIDNKVAKVFEWNFGDIAREKVLLLEDEYLHKEVQLRDGLLRYLLPATEQEYLTDNKTP